MKYSISEVQGTGYGRIAGVLFDTGGKDRWRNILRIYRRFRIFCMRPRPVCGRSNWKRERNRECMRTKPCWSCLALPGSRLRRSVTAGGMSASIRIIIPWFRTESSVSAPMRERRWSTCGITRCGDRFMYAVAASVTRIFREGPVCLGITRILPIRLC